MHFPFCNITLDFGMETGLLGKRPEAGKSSGGCCMLKPKQEPRVAWMKARRRWRERWIHSKDIQKVETTW